MMAMSDPNVAFTLRVRLYRREADERLIVIRAWDDLGWDEAGRIRLSCEVTHGRKVIFPKGMLYCALHGTSDGIAARELVMSLVAMRPGDTDSEYFADYTPEQLEWASYHGEALSVEREFRYCDKDGNVRGSRGRRAGAKAARATKTDSMGRR